MASVDLPEPFAPTIARTSPRQDCPTRLDILFVPGGFVGETMCDSATLAFLADRGAKASYVTSVCNGSLVLAAAGLLDGYRSATHWAARGHLAQLGVEVSTERVSASWLRNTTRSRRSTRVVPKKRVEVVAVRVGDAQTFRKHTSRRC